MPFRRLRLAAGLEALRLEIQFASRVSSGEDAEQGIDRFSLR